MKCWGSILGSPTPSRRQNCASTLVPLPALKHAVGQVSRQRVQAFSSCVICRTHAWRAPVHALHLRMKRLLHGLLQRRSLLLSDSEIFRNKEASLRNHVKSTIYPFSTNSLSNDLQIDCKLITGRQIKTSWVVNDSPGLISGCSNHGCSMGSGLHLSRSPQF